jgi:hypothetical protein
MADGICRQADSKIIRSSQEVLPIPGAAARRVKPPPQKDRPAKTPKGVYGWGLPKVPERGMGVWYLFIGRGGWQVSLSKSIV